MTVATLNVIQTAGSKVFDLSLGALAADLPAGEYPLCLVDAANAAINDALAAKPSSIQPVAHLSLHATAGARHTALGIKAAANELPDGEYDLYASLPTQPVAEGCEELAAASERAVEYTMAAVQCYAEEWRNNRHEDACNTRDRIRNMLQADAKLLADRAQLAERVAYYEELHGALERIRQVDPKFTPEWAASVIAGKAHTPQPHADEVAKGGERGRCTRLKKIAEWLKSSAQDQQVGPDEWAPASQFDYELGQAGAEIDEIVSICTKECRGDCALCRNWYERSNKAAAKNVAPPSPAEDGGNG
jgi:hypothetical protein